MTPEVLKKQLWKNSCSDYRLQPGDPVAKAAYDRIVDLELEVKGLREALGPSQ